MKVSRRLNGSICAAILSSRSAVAASCGVQQPSRDSSARSHHSRAHAASFENATPGHSSTCVNTSTWLRSTFLTTLSIPRPPAPQRYISTSTPPRAGACAAAAEQPSLSPPIEPPHNNLTKAELLSLVDQQDVGPVEEYLHFHRDPYLRRYAQPDGPNLIVSDSEEEMRYPSREDAIHGDEEVEKVVGQLVAAISRRRRRPSLVSLDTIFNIYHKLPEPRMLHISGPLRSYLLRVLGTPGKRNTKSMLRYFAAVADVKNCGISLRLQEWNYALAYASRHVRRTTETDAEATLKIWSEMEREEGVKGNEVTFNILFDVASKSGNFALAEMIFKEMETRGMPFNRYHHVSLIHYFGLKRDGDGIRAAYREMVQAGEMIDSVVLNCVISGLLKAGDEAAAEGVYERMKASGSRQGKKRPSRDYVANKVITKVLMMFGRVRRDRAVAMGATQAQVTPDLQTYRLLVNHFALRVADLAKVARYLDEMRLFDVPLHGSIFLALFKGFSLHGGFSGATWSEQRLRGVFSALLDALDSGVEGLSVEVWLARWVLRAYDKCASPEAMREAYEILSERMDLAEEQQDLLENYLAHLLNGGGVSSVFDKRGFWNRPTKRRSPPVVRRRLS